MDLDMVLDTAVPSMVKQFSYASWSVLWRIWILRSWICWIWWLWTWIWSWIRPYHLWLSNLVMQAGLYYGGYGYCALGYAGYGGYGLGYGLGYGRTIYG